MEVGGVMVSFSTGVMESVLRKLQILATEVADSKPKGLGAEITGLKGELESINTNLQAFAKMREPIGPAKQWMKQVRETVFDIDDWADLYRTDREADRHVGIVKVLKQKLKNLGGGKNEPPNNQIHEFKQLVQEANERFKRYELLQRTSSNSVEQTALPFVEDAQDPRERALHAEETALVGIHGPTEDLLASLLPCDDTGEPAVKDLKVVFLVGSGGLGKTTLAKQVLRQPRLQLEFQPRVFVHVGRNPCEKAVLMGILNQAMNNGSRPKDYESHKEVQDLIDEIKTSLQGKRYFMVIDDVWNTAIWQLIKCALPDENKGSRVIITARKEDIATSSFVDSSGVHKKKPTMSIDDQKYLFHGRIFGPGKGCPPELDGMTNDILEKCRGVPLAIIVAAGLLASKGKAEAQYWKPVHASITSIRDQEEVEIVRKILYLSYTDLPNNIKSCFLYLSVFPEGHEMRKDRVIRRWIAEGFISKGGGGKESSQQKIGESCFEELVSRGLIHPLPVEDNGERGYLIHDLVRDLIISLSAEENFVTLSSQLIDDNALPHDKVRRLSLQNHHRVTPTVMGNGILSNVRSVTVFGRHERNHGLGKFRFLRVLDLEDADALENDDVESLINKKLFQLKYLGLGGEKITSLPEHIEELGNLETLDISRTRVMKLDVNKEGAFQGLVHLLVTDAKLPTGVENMKELQELSMVEVSDDSTLQSVQKLGELEKLRTLGLKWSRKYCASDEDPWQTSFVGALHKLGNHSLKSLCIDAGKDSSLDFLVESWSPSLELEEFKLACSHYYFPRLPTKMADAKLLAYLEIGLDTVHEGDLKTLGGLPTLTLLKLRAAKASDRKKLAITGKQGFPGLEEFWFESANGDVVALPALAFDKGAMPKLWKLRLRCNARSVAVHPAASSELGLGNLASLKLVHVKMDCKGADVPAVRNAEAAITRAVKASPACRLEITV